VPTRTLVAGEELTTAAGATRIVDIRRLDGEHRVFNLEVEGEHWYFVGEAGVLAHNGCARGQPHRGRVQAQGGGTEASVPWAQSQPPTVAQGKTMLDELADSLTPAERRAREGALKKAKQFVERAGEGGGVDAPVSKSFAGKGGKNVRVDVEVRKGRAFVPDEE
jgi:hypothetical protein